MDLAIPDIKPIIGSWIANIQNHKYVGRIKKQRLSQTKPNTNPWTGPKIQPITIIGIHENEIVKFTPGIGILMKPNKILNANNTAIVIKNFVDLKTRKGCNGNQNFKNLLVFPFILY